MPSTTQKLQRLTATCLMNICLFCGYHCTLFEVPSAAYNGDSAQALTDSYDGGVAGIGGGWMLAKGWYVPTGRPLKFSCTERLQSRTRLLT